MNVLKQYRGFFVYLAGPIDFEKDGGVGYRKSLKEKLKKIGVSEEMILDPCDKPVIGDDFIDIDSEKEQFDRLREHRMWDEAEKCAKMTMHIDLRFVDKSDLVIATVNPNIPMCGTWDEVFMARNQKKPVILIDPRGREKTHMWAIGRVGYKNIFKTQDDAIAYLDDILHTRIPVDMTEWLFLQFNGKKKK